MNIALIPARRGSKSILNKNLMRVGSKTLVDRAIASVLSAGIFDKVILSTDIPCLIDEHKRSTTVCLRLRHPSLCTDAAHMVPVAKDALAFIGAKPDALLWLIQPTAPFRLSMDYTFISRLFKEEDDTNSVISVTEVGSMHPNRMYTVKRGVMWPLRFTSFDNKEDLPTIYLRNGCYYVARAGMLQEHSSFFLKSCRPYLMERERSINVDAPFDLKIAQFLAKEGLH